MSALRGKVHPLDVLSRRGVLPGRILTPSLGYAEAMNAAEAVSCGLDGAVVPSAK